MRLATMSLLIMLSGGIASAQQFMFDPVTLVPRLDLSVGYSHLSANAPPAGCKCFSMQGSYFSAGLHLNQWLSAAAEVNGGHSNDISLLGQNLTLMTYSAGPRVEFYRRRLDLFGEALFGIANASNSYFPTTTSYTSSASGFALSAGGGADFNLTPHLAVRLFDAKYLRTSLPNGADNSQNQLVIESGIVFKLRGRDNAAAHFVAPEQPARIELNCSAKQASVLPGQLVDVMARAKPEPGKGSVDFAWSTNGGNIQGSGDRVTVNTEGVAPGAYEISNHTTLTDNADIDADCQVQFSVLAPPQPKVLVAVVTPPPPPPVPQAVVAAADREFHENVPDALFDYDKWNIRPDALLAIDHAAAYMNTHLEIHVLIGGFSDERGTDDYNVVLGLKRANATKDALVALGVASERIQVVSYGKGTQVCTNRDEACYQQNRRAAFSLHY
jgi:outer membrane protein OmpA-like peptidoglycan-associated protein